MKVYAVFIEDGKLTKLESLHTTQLGATNRQLKLAKRGVKSTWQITKPLRGDLLRFIAKHVQNECHRKGTLKPHQTIDISKIRRGK